MLELIMHRFCCKRCGTLFWLWLNFMDGTKRYTRVFEFTVMELLQYGRGNDVPG